MSDFDRFKLRRARQLRNKIRSKAYFIMKAKSKKAGTLWGKKKGAKKEKKLEKAALKKASSKKK